MPNLIEITPPSGVSYQTNQTSSTFWNVNPVQMHLYWLMTQPAPPPVTLNYRFFNFTNIPAYADFTDWRLESEAVHELYEMGTVSPSTQITRINDELQYIGDLGVLTSGQYNKDLVITFENLNLLSEGMYLVKIISAVTAINPVTNVRQIISAHEFVLRFYANAGSFLSVPPFVTANRRYTIYEHIINQISLFPERLRFHYFKTGPLPAAENLFHFGLKPQNGGAPTILNPSEVFILTNYVAVHDYYSKVEVSFSSAIESFDPGVYNYTLNIGYDAYDDVEAFSITHDVSIIVYDETAIQFLVNPETIEQQVVIGGNAPETVAVGLVSNLPWQIISELPEWLAVSTTNGTGSQTLYLNFLNYNNLQPGNYFYDLVISNGGSSIVLSITMEVIVFIENPFVPGAVYFSKELEYLRFTSQHDDIYIDIAVIMTVFKLDGTSKEFVRTYSVPLAGRKGEFLLGTLVHDLFDEVKKLEQIITDFYVDFFSPGYRPAIINLTYEEKEFFPSEDFEGISGAINGLLFVKGYKPFITTNQMALLSPQQQYLSRISKNSIIAVNFTHTSNPMVVVKRNGIVISQRQLLAFGPGRLIYTYFKMVSNFNVGDLIELFVVDGTDTRCHRYLVHYDGIDSTHIIFENSNGVLEPFELIGRRRINSNYRDTVNRVYKDAMAFDEKLDSENIQSFLINTGMLQPEDHIIIDAIKKSKNMWCSIKGPAGPYMKANCITSKALVSDTNSNDYPVDLEFNILENSYAVFCH